MSLSVAEQTRRGPAGDWRVLRVGGCLDLHGAPVLRARLVELLSSGQRCLVLDLEGVEFLDSTGLGVLVGGLKRTRRVQGSFQLVLHVPPGAQGAPDDRVDEGVLDPPLGGQRDGGRRLGTSRRGD